MSRLTIIGIGPGSAEYFMPAARNRMRSAHTVIAAKRILPMLQDVCGSTEAQFQPMGKIKDTLEVIDGLLHQEKDVALVVSGDPLMYSLYKTILNQEISEDWEMDVIPGIGSMQMLGFRGDHGGRPAYERAWKKPDAGLGGSLRDGESKGIFLVQQGTGTGVAVPDHAGIQPA